MPRHRSLSIAGGIAVAAIAAGVLTTPLAASAYPSWSDVQAAKGNADATKTQVADITAALDSLQAQAATKSQAALTADAANAASQHKLVEATSQADALAAQVSAQKKKASEAHQEAGQLAAHLYRIGGTSVEGQLFTGADADATLYKLGALSQLTTQWQTVLDQATVASKAVSSLSAQARVAEDERDRRAQEAAASLQKAQTAQKVADAEVQTAAAHQSTLYSQLATLNSTTAVVEKQYRQGVAAKAAYEAQQRAAAAEAARKAAAAQEAASAGSATGSGNSGSTGASGSAGSGGSSGSSGSGSSGSGSSGSGSSGSGSSGSGSSGGSLGSGVVDDPAGAQAYARGSLSSHGWAASQMSCLVLLWNQESGWRTSALNVSSGAYGIPQALPATKLASSGLDWQTSYRTQINWGLGYIGAVYGSPCGAWAHEVAHNWY